MLYTLYKKNQDESILDKKKVNKIRTFIHCEHCNNLLYGEWTYALSLNKNIDTKIFNYMLDGKNFPLEIENEAIIKDYRNDIENFFTQKTCPICKKRLIEKRKDEPFPIYKFKGYFASSLNFENSKFSPTSLYIEDEWYNNYIRGKSSTRLLDCLSTEEISTEIHNYSKTIFEYKSLDSFGKMKEFYLDKYSTTQMEIFNSDFYTEAISTAREKYTKLKKKLGNSEVMSFANINLLSSTQNLKTLIKIAFQTEHDISSISERLVSLYFDDIEISTELKTADYILTHEKNEKIKYLELDIENLKNNISNGSYNIALPKAPEKPNLPKQPEEPIYRKSNIFNRKRIELENNLLKQQYEKALLKYNKSCETIEKKYRATLENYTNIVLDIKQQKENELNILLNKKQEELNSLTEINQNCDCSQTVALQNLENKRKLIKNEIMQAEKLLKGLFDLRNYIYSSNIIFHKYCNIVAISTFHEYLSSGRCSSLEGTNGAYNLFESEARANLIIKELSEINVSLKKIQENQYLLYSAIQDTKKELANLADTTKEILNDVHEIKNLTNDISFLVEKSAYYSATTAYYAKKNMELTNSLGFLIALK